MVNDINLKLEDFEPVEYELGKKSGSPLKLKDFEPVEYEVSRKIVSPLKIDEPPLELLSIGDSPIVQASPSIIVKESKLEMSPPKSSSPVMLKSHNLTHVKKMQEKTKKIIQNAISPSLAERSNRMRNVNKELI